MEANHDKGYFKTVAPKEFYAKIYSDPTAYILDVRTPEEYAQGHLQGAHLLDWLNNISFRKEATKLDKSKTIYAYCRSGARSAEAAQYLASLEYKAVDMDGGILRWVSDGLPVIK